MALIAPGMGEGSEGEMGAEEKSEEDRGTEILHVGSIRNVV